MKGYDFDVTVVHDGETVRCVGHISASYPGRGPSMENAGGDPPEPAEIEDCTIYAEDGTEIEDPDGDIVDALYDSIMEAAGEAMESDKAAAAEAREDARRDK